MFDLEPAIFFSEFSCSFIPGDGTDGGKKNEEVIEGLSAADCINACISRRKQDNRINGVTVYSSGDPGCWCESEMDGIQKNSLYKTCFLNG